MSGNDQNGVGSGRDQQGGSPPLRPVRVAGILDTISASQPDILLSLKDGTLVPGHLQHHDPVELRALFATLVVISGLDHFDQGRRLLRVDVVYLGPARHQDAMWETAPVPRTDASTPVAELVHQDHHTGVNASFGNQPGKEVDEELEALKDVRTIWNLTRTFSPPCRNGLWSTSTL